MISIKIFVPVKKEAVFLAAGREEYIKRLGNYCNIKVISGKDAVGEFLKEKNRGFGQKRHLISVTALGNTVSSEKFAEKINDLAVSGVSEIIFFFEDTDFDEALCISKLEFPVSVLSLILTEQIYRAFKILGNEKYHK